MTKFRSEEQGEKRLYPNSETHFIALSSLPYTICYIFHFQNQISLICLSIFFTITVTLLHLLISEICLNNGDKTKLDSDE